MSGDLQKGENRPAEGTRDIGVEDKNLITSDHSEWSICAQRNAGP